MTHSLRGTGRIDATRLRVCIGVFVTLLVAGLLVAFHQVVRGAVEQGQSRRQAAALRADAVWRCNALHGSRVRDQCVSRLDAPSSQELATLAGGPGP